MVIGGVGALAVASAAWWWLKSPKKPTNKTKDKDLSDSLERRRQKEASLKPEKVEIQTFINNPELPQQTQGLNPLIELTINQPEEVKYEPVLVDKKEMYLKYEAQDFFGILDNHPSKEGFNIETIDIDIKTKKEQILKIKDVKKDSIQKCSLKPITKDFQIQQNSYVFVNHPIDGQKIMLIGKYLGQNQDDEDKIMVLSGSLLHDVELQERIYDASDVFVPEPVVEQKNEAVKSSVNQEELTKDTEVKKRKLEQTESDLEAARREKLSLELKLAAEKKNKQKI